MKLTPHVGKIALEVIKDTHSSGGLYLPDNSYSVRKATVVATGDGEYVYGKFIEMPFSEGDVVIIPANANIGTTIDFEGKELVVIHQSQVVAKISESDAV